VVDQPLAARKQNATARTKQVTTTDALNGDRVSCVRPGDRWPSRLPPPRGLRRKRNAAFIHHEAAFGWPPAPSTQALRA